MSSLWWVFKSKHTCRLNALSFKLTYYVYRSARTCKFSTPGFFFKKKIRQCNFFRRLKWVLFHWTKGDRLGHLFLKSKTTLGVFLLPCSPFFLFLLILGLLWTWEINLSIVGPEYKKLCNLMISNIHLMLFQYYCFIFIFITFFMVWSPIYMYVIVFFYHWKYFYNNNLKKLLSNPYLHGMMLVSLIHASFLLKQVTWFLRY